MTLEYIQDQLKHLEAIKGDDETAHSEEDKLYRSVLQYIADNSVTKFGRLADEALKAGEIDFCRWCA